MNEEKAGEEEQLFPVYTMPGPFDWKKDLLNPKNLTLRYVKIKPGEEVRQARTLVEVEDKRGTS